MKINKKFGEYYDENMYLFITWLLLVCIIYTLKRTNKNLNI